MTVHGTCPACHYLAPENKQTGQLRTDHLRRHILTKHPACEDAYPGVQGFENTKVTNALYLRGKGGKYEDGFCLDCGSWVSLHGIAQAHKAEAMRNHTCREKQVREYMNKLTADTKQEPAAHAQEKVLLKVFKQNGADDFIEFKDNLDFDVGRTVARLTAAAKKPAATPPSGSVLAQFKKQKRFLGYVSAIEKQEHDRISKWNAEADDDDKQEFDEMTALCIVCDDAIKSQKFKEREQELRAEVNLKDDKIDMQAREIQRGKAVLCEEINERDAEIERLNKEVDALKARLKLTAVAAPSQVPDTIKHQGGSTVGQWSLQYQG